LHEVRPATWNRDVDKWHVREMHARIHQRFDGMGNGSRDIVRHMHCISDHVGVDARPGAATIRVIGQLHRNAPDIAITPNASMQDA
jgi:hypothetical protein